MNVLVACEFSGIVREAFRGQGHNAWSCDLLPSEIKGHHLQMDIFEGLKYAQWDIMIAHPPCTYLAVSGARWFKERRAEQTKALAFVHELFQSPINRICIENPISIISTHFRKPDQIIHPWQFGHGEVKATCLWLKNLPKLTPTRLVSGREARVHKCTSSPERWKERSRTLIGIVQAMAEQWG